MAKDATKVRVALTGDIWVAPEGTEIPASVDVAPAAPFVNLGFTTDDGCTFTIGRETEDLPGWQSADPLRTLITSEPKQVAYTLRQLERSTVTATLGGTVTETGAGSGLYRWEPGPPGEAPVSVVLIDFMDGDLTYRFGFRRAQNLGEAEFSLVRNDAINLPNEWHVLAASGGLKPWFIDSNDPAMAPAGA